jgi:hypothetical protein
MTATIRLDAISLDCEDPRAPARFYARLTGAWLLDPAGHPFCFTTLIPES